MKLNDWGYVFTYKNEFWNFVNTLKATMCEQVFPEGENFYDEKFLGEGNFEKWPKI